MEVLLIILSVLLISGGIIFSILPPFPGPLLTYLALVCTHNISNGTEFSTTSFVVWGIIGAIIIVADFIFPVAATKKFGGTKAGVIGGMIGTVLGVVLPIPMGIILGPLFGAIIGDLYGGNRIRAAFKSGFGSFLGFLLATGFKLLYALILGGVIAWEVGGFTIGKIAESF